MNENKMIAMWAVIIILLIGFFSIKPVPYKVESAKGLGDAVRIGDKVYNQANLDKFIEKVAAKKAADIRAVTYNEAGNAIISKLSYDGYNIRLTIDARRDKAAEGFWKVYKSRYAGIEKVGAEYYLTIPGTPGKLVFTGN